MNRIINDTERFSEGLLLGFTQVFTGALTIVGTFGFMLVLCWQIALVVLFITPLSIFIAKFIATRTFSMFKLQSKTKGEQTAIIDEMVGNAKTVKAFSHEDEAQAKFDDINDRLGRVSLKAIFFSSLPMIFLQESFGKTAVMYSTALQKTKTVLFRKILPKIRMILLFCVLTALLILLLPKEMDKLLLLLQ